VKEEEEAQRGYISGVGQKEERGGGASGKRR
jgi:hypothetical protein